MASRGTTPRAIRISDDLWQRAKEASERTGRTITSVVKDALEEFAKEK